MDWVFKQGNDLMVEDLNRGLIFILRLPGTLQFELTWVVIHWTL